MNLRPQKPCAVIKGTKWLRNYAYLIWKRNLYAGAPHFTIYIYISCITTSGPPALEFRQTLQCSEGKNTGNIIMLLQGHLSWKLSWYMNDMMVPWKPGWNASPEPLSYPLLSLSFIVSLSSSLSVTNIRTWWWQMTHMCETLSAQLYSTGTASGGWSLRCG